MKSSCQQLKKKKKKKKNQLKTYLRSTGGIQLKYLQENRENIIENMSEDVFVTAVNNF